MDKIIIFHTGLDNYMLEYDNVFNENVARMIINFLNHLQQPVCIVAHNGDRFDFPILMKELKRLNIELPSTVKCLDSLPIFRNIDYFQIVQDENISPDDVKPIKNDALPSTSTSSTSTSIAIEISNGGETEEKAEEEKIDWQKRNETTPHQQKIPAANGGHPMNRKVFVIVTNTI